MREIKGLRWWMIGLIMLGSVINYLTRSTLAVAAPTLLKELHISAREYSWIVGAFQGAIMAQPVCGYILDVLGLKIGFAIFATSWSLVNMAHCLANSWPAFAWLRGLLGFSEGSANPAGMKATAEWFPAGERGLAGGVYNIGASVGSMIAPPLVAWAILVYNWRAAFLITGGLGLVWAVQWLLLYQSPDTHPALSSEEKGYISSGQEKHLRSDGTRPSLTRILMSSDLFRRNVRRRCPGGTRQYGVANAYHAGARTSPMTKREDQNHPSRRSLLQAAAVPVSLYLDPGTVFGSQANSAIEIGVVGCGGRGVYIGRFFLEDANVRILALADPIPAQMEALKTELKLDSPRTYGGLNGYRELVKSKLDAIVIESPPYFHPEQAAAAVEAGKHVFLAKPVAVDVPGCQSIIETGRKARGRLSTWIDFQTRMRPLYQEAVRRVGRGDIGAPVVTQIAYHNSPQIFRPNPADTTLQRRLRNWNLDRTLSGEIIVEQDIHMIDVADWFLGAHPLEAQGRLGRARTERQGDMADFFSVQYAYPNGVAADFIGTRFASGYRDQCVRVQGTAGTVDSHYMGAVNIAGANPWKGAESDHTRLGAQTNVQDFLASIRSGRPIDNTAAAAQSNLTAILGRTAAYRKRGVTWEEMMHSGEKLEAGIQG